jgi:hypothetical protein
MDKMNSDEEIELSDSDQITIQKDDSLRNVVSFSESFWKKSTERHGEELHQNLGVRAYIEIQMRIYNRSIADINYHEEIWVITISKMDFIDQIMINIDELLISKSERIRDCHIYVMVVDPSERKITTIGGISKSGFIERAELLPKRNRSKSQWSIHYSQLILDSFYDMNIEEKLVKKKALEFLILGPSKRDESNRLQATRFFDIIDRSEQEYKLSKSRSGIDLYLTIPAGGFISQIELVSAAKRRLNSLKNFHKHKIEVRVPKKIQNQNIGDIPQELDSSIKELSFKESNEGSIDNLEYGYLDEIPYDDALYIIGSMIEENRFMETDGMYENIVDFDDISDMSDLMTEKLSIDEKESGVDTTKDNMSFWTLLFCVASNSCTPRSREWLIQQESKLFISRLRSYCKTEEDVISVIRANDLISTGNDSDEQEENQLVLVPHFEIEPSILSECETLFKTCYPNSPLPSIWFTCNFIHCMDGFSTMTVITKKGNCYVCYKHLHDYILARNFTAKMKEHISLVKKKKGESPWIALNPWNDKDDMKREMKEIIKDINSFLADTANQSSKSIRGYELPPIEECASKRYLPLCSSESFKKMEKKKQHLKYKERLYYSALLLDCGYEKKQILDHLFKYFSQDGIDEAKFKREYAPIVERTENGMWEESKRRIFYSPLCDTLAKEESKIQNGIVSGCPYSNYDETNLYNTLKEDGFNESDIQSIIEYKKNGDFRMACASHLTILHGVPPIVEGKGSKFIWKPQYPHNYTEMVFSISKKGDEKK